MKKLLLLFAALLVAGCGEKSSPEDSDSAIEKPTGEPSADAVKPSPAEPPVAESPSEESSDNPPSLSDADVERLLKEAVDMESLEERDDLLYQDNKPYSGWVKMIHDSGQVQALGQFKDGKLDGLFTVWAGNGQKVKEGIWKDGKQDGPYTEWHANGQKAAEVTFKDTYPHGPWTRWHKNGQKKSEVTYQDDKQISGKYWNSKGEEVETEEEANE